MHRLMVHPEKCNCGSHAGSFITIPKRMSGDDLPGQSSGFIIESRIRIGAKETILDRVQNQVNGTVSSQIMGWSKTATMTLNLTLIDENNEMR
jgi:hypothetical protein